MTGALLVKRGAIVLAFLFLTPAARAFESDLQAWTLLAAQAPVYGRLLGYLEVQPRVGRDLTSLERVLVRPALGHEIRPGTTVWLGYLWNPSFQGARRDEHRVWQQLTHATPLQPMPLVHRLRLEQRFLPGVGDPALRFRYMLRALPPLTGDATWSVALWNELMVNLNTAPGGPTAGFDQNRLFAGVSRKLAELRLEPGYLANLVNGPRSDRLNHALYVMALLSL